MVTAIGGEIESVIAEMGACESDAVQALQLPRGEIATYRQEVAEIRAEFATSSNGPPPGPLPGSSPPATPPALPLPRSDDLGHGRTVDDVTNGRV